MWNSAEKISIVTSASPYRAVDATAGAPQDHGQGDKHRHRDQCCPDTQKVNHGIAQALGARVVLSMSQLDHDISIADFPDDRHRLGLHATVTRAFVRAAP
jgi:hypothetical protein